jgi:hypothetical protein
LALGLASNGSKQGKVLLVAIKGTLWPSSSYCPSIRDI